MRELRGNAPFREPAGFESDIAELIGMLGNASTAPQDEQAAAVRATPAADGSPSIWILGSSKTSASMAGRLGFPFAYASHFGGSGLGEALATYRKAYSGKTGRPPYSLATANVVVARNNAEAARVSAPFMLQEVGLATGKAELIEPRSIEKALAAHLTLEERGLADQLSRSAFIGEPVGVVERLREFKEASGANEIMVNLVAGDYQDCSRRTSDQRLQSLELLARQWKSTCSAR